MASWWQPDPVLEEIDNVLVLRDDLVPGGSKMRFLPYLVGEADEIVYGSPFCGGAALALSEWGKRMGAKVTIFYAKRKVLHARQLAVLRNGATIYQVPHGYMTHVQAKARHYAKEVGARFLPLGFDTPAASAPFIEQIRQVRKLAGPVDQVWCATGSGMLARCLGVAFDPIPVIGVSVGLESKSAKQAFTSNVSLISSLYDFAKETRASAPFPSCGNYDRKAWELCAAQREGYALFWNVMGHHGPV